MAFALAVLVAVILDYCLGEPRNAYHPLVFFGRWVAFSEKVFWRYPQFPWRQKLVGLMACLFALLPSSAALLIENLPALPKALCSVAVLYFCIGARSLQRHAVAVYQALLSKELPLARERVGHIVSRQTQHMNDADVRRAAIESVLENGADAVFAPIFWFVLLGPFGALFYRFANTLDAMWGYKNERYLYFGWAAARLDDLLNWLPARLTAFSYALLGNTPQAFLAWQRQAPLLESPNGGPVMTAGAGALNLRLGGPAFYHGQLKNKPWFGGQKDPENHDIELAVCLIYKTLGLWIILLLALGALLN
ncbi:MAG: adenosylcobinamide-phosphate synthase CbiB [Methylomonas sp.]|nr:adenosylcobinamide-phosphate synthase CbiB [Methylomonas sp.]